jgi:hypothetical protein
MSGRQGPGDTTGGAELDSATRQRGGDDQGDLDHQVTGISAEGRNPGATSEDRSTADGPESTGDVAAIVDQRNDQPLEPRQRGT